MHPESLCQFCGASPALGSSDLTQVLHLKALPREKSRMAQGLLLGFANRSLLPFVR